MIETKPFQQRDYASAAAYDLEFSGRAVSGVGIRFSALLGGAAANIADDAAWRLLKVPEINQSENPIVRMRGQSWRHLSALGNGRYDHHAATTTTASANAFLDFQRWMPLAAINAADKKIFIRGEFNPLTSYSGTAPTLTSGKLRPWTRSSQRDTTQGFFRPKFSEVSVPINVANDDQQQPIKFEQDQYLSGFMLTCDDSTARNPRTDGLIKNIRLDITNADTGLTENIRLNWGQLRHSTQALAGFNEEDFGRSVGVVFIPLRDERNSQANFARFFKNGDSVTFHFDSASSVDDEYTAATIANGAQVVIDTIAWTPVAGSGDTAAQIGLIDPTSRNGTTENARRAARRFA